MTVDGFDTFTHYTGYFQNESLYIYKMQIYCCLELAKTYGEYSHQSNILRYSKYMEIKAQIQQNKMKNIYAFI